MNLRETAEFQRGRTGERIVASYIQRRGWYVVPSYDYSGDEGNKAPKMQGFRDAFVLPDLDACRAGIRVWLEVKTKATPNFWRKTQTWEHGIDLHHWRQYEHVQRLTGCKVYLVIVEESTGDVRMASIDKLKAGDVRVGTPFIDRMGKRVTLINFPQSAFNVVFNVGRQLPQPSHIVKAASQQLHLPEGSVVRVRVQNAAGQDLRR